LSHYFQVGPNFEAVVDKCSRGRYQPLLLLYALPQKTQCTNGYQSDASVTTITPPNRRAITPSPEISKTQIGLTRRAITPTPNRAACEYQNLSVIQNKIFGTNGNDETDGYISRKTVETIMNAQYQNLNVIQEKIFCNNLSSSGVSSSSSEEKEYLSRSQLDAQMKAKQQLSRSLSADTNSVSSSPSSNGDGLSIPDHLNQPRRRDSGNWSGDRNSASSSSSTTLDNPYMYLMNKRNNNSMPPSPTRNGAQQFYDAGYDSYSLSSTDSYPPKQSPVMHLAKIPEQTPSLTGGDCEKLCHEADQLLEKSKLVEDAQDFETALVLCNAAAGKARAAMNAPYSNPHTMTFARMKHNTCVMRARSLYRRLLVERGSEFTKDQSNTNSLTNPRHSRQSSKDRTMQRQNSKELMNDDKSMNGKTIEIYATLPKKKVSLKLSNEHEDQIVAIEPETKKSEREGRSIFGRSKDSKEKRSRSEDRNKPSSKDFEPPALSNAKDTLKKHKEEKDEKKDKDKTQKKQHKIRRKLLMGGLIRRKNRSMPDLTEGAAEEQNKNKNQKSADDSTVGVSPKKDTSIASGYLSEGHLEYHVSNANPTLERSKLMRKSFHGSGRQLVMAKVPPPPPLRKTSALSRDPLEEFQHQKMLGNQQDQQPLKPFHEANMSIISNVSSNTSMSEDSCQTIITCAQVHQEQSPIKPIEIQTMHYQRYAAMKSEGVDEVDHIIPMSHHQRHTSGLDLPPYPSPPSTTCHSRQASEDFPPPPPSIDLEPLNEQISEIQNLQIKRSDSTDAIQGCTSILAHLQQRQEAMKMNTDRRQDSENWLKELQMKQMSMKKDVQQAKPLDNNVKDIASRFEQVRMSPLLADPKRINNTANVRTGMSGLINPNIISPVQISTTPHTIKKMDNGEEVEYAIVDKKKNQIRFEASQVAQQPSPQIPQSLVQEELREVEMLNQVMQNTLANIGKRTKKKSVSFCDQVTLVATANDDEDDSFVPNPILERVLKSINNGNNSGEEEESKDQVDTPRSSSVLMTKQIPLQAPHESSPQQQIQQPQTYSPLSNHQVNGLPYNDNYGFESPKPTVAAVQQQQQQQQQMYPMQSQSLPRTQHEIMMMMMQKKPDHIANVGSGLQHMQMNSYPIQQQQPQQQHFDYVGNQGSGLSNLGIPLQSAQSPPQNVPLAASSPYMQVPSNNNNKTPVVRNTASGYPPYPTLNQTPMTYPQQQLANFLMNRLYGGQQQQPQQPQMGQVYQKPPQMMMSPPMQVEQNAFQMQTAYQRIPYNVQEAMSQQQQDGYQLAQMKKKVSFEPGTKGGNDTLTNPANPPSPTVSTTSADSNNNIPTKIAISTYNNTSIVKASAKTSQCNLCRKKHTVGNALYCADCDLYLSRFQTNSTTRR
jgi:hypothetical protein